MQCGWCSMGCEKLEAMRGFLFVASFEVEKFIEAYELGVFEDEAFINDCNFDVLIRDIRGQFEKIGYWGSVRGGSSGVRGDRAQFCLFQL